MQQGQAGEHLQPVHLYFYGLNHIVGGNILLTVGAIAGGACFGDNIGLISDTTIVSSGIQGVEVVKRVKHQGVWSGLVLLTGVIAFGIVGMIIVHFISSRKWCRSY